MEDSVISSKALLELAEKLEKKYPHWLKLVSLGISKEKDWKNYSDKKCSPENARHISCGNIKSQFHRRLFMKVGGRLLVDAQKEIEEIEELVKQTA